MIKLWKIITIILVCFGFVGFLAVGYWFKTEGPAMAVDYNSNTEIFCEEPIPVGVAIDTTVNFLDKIYQRYQGNAIQTASKQVDDLMGAIAGNNGKVCDFNKECKAQVGTGGPDLTIGAQLLPGMSTLGYTYTVPGCKLKEATGNPCPDLSPYVKDAGQTLNQWLNQDKASTLSLDEMANSLEAQANNVHDLFGGETAVVPAGLEERGEVVGETMISEAELVKRYIKNVDQFWLTPNPQKNNCALSELDKKRIAQGTMGDKYPLQCMDALSKEMYAPKAWSEMCQTECATFDQECKDCLAKCDGDSVYATLNCKIYNMNTNDKCAPRKESFGPHLCCGQFCADGFNTRCKECLCEGLTQDQCLDWICGGSKANWVCCHEEPIQNPQYYTANQIFSTFDTLEVVTTPGGGQEITNVSRGETFAFAYATLNNLWIKPEYQTALGSLDLALAMANLYRETTLRESPAGKKCNIREGKVDLRAIDKVPYSKITAELTTVFASKQPPLVFPDKDLIYLSCYVAPTARNGFTEMSGGAMGWGQFMPSTWWGTNGKDGVMADVKELTGNSYANPWDINDAFLGSAIYLRDRINISGGNIRKGVGRYMGNVAEDAYLVRKTICIQRIFQDQISRGCFTSGNNNADPKCKINIDTYIEKECSSAKLVIKSILDKLAFWR